MPNENNYNGYQGNGNSPADNNSFYSPDELNNMLNGLQSNDNTGYSQNQPADPYAAEPINVNPSAYPYDPAYQNPGYQDQNYQEPYYQDPNYQQPVYQDQNYQEPVYQDPDYQEPVYQDPNYQQPVYQDPNYQEPVYQDTNYQQPVYQDPNYQQPVYENSGYREYAESDSPSSDRGHFTINISDDDYNAPDELDSQLGAQSGSADRPRFEVHIEDDDMPDYNAEAFNYQEPVKLVFDNKNDLQQLQKSSKKKKKKKQSNPYSPLIVFLLVVVILTTTVSVIGISCINDILAFSRKSDTVTVTIPADATTDQVIEILSQSKLVKQEWFCRLYNYAFTTLLGKSEREYKGGVYYVDGNLGLEGYLTEFSTTQTGAETYMVTIPEGYTVYQIAKRLDDFGVCDESKFLASLKGTNFSYTFVKDIGDNSNRTFKLEGYLYPDTYEFYEGDDPNNVIRKMLEQSDEMWTDEYQKRADELGYTRDQIMIIASIIQREAANVEQMDEISSVIHNRLSKPATWPSIDCDSTSTYITRYIAPYVTTGEATKYENAYNTYSIKGLPPGPICNPGDDAINAALYPSDTNYYFFRHDNSGKIYLASTQAEHDANANLVLKANKESS